MARDMTDKEILKMELAQLKKEVDTPRTPVSELLSLVNNLSSVIFNFLPPKPCKALMLHEFLTFELCISVALPVKKTVCFAYL